MGHKILLADDSITIQKVIELTFTDEDFELHTVGNGQKAIEEIRTVKPDIVLCDIIMPEKSGYEVCEHIKSSEDLKHIPVLLLTGAFEPFDQERAKKAGCNGFLAKPFEPQTLISKVKELLQSTAGTQTVSIPGSPVAADTSTPSSTPSTPAPPPAPAQEEAGEATVMMSSGTMPTPPGSTPEPPSPLGSSEESGFQDDLATEAGERELSIDSDDRTMFLGQPEEPSGGSDDDIWAEVQQGSSAPTPPAPPAPPSQPDEGQTVMMSSPIVPEPVAPSEPATPVTPETVATPDTPATKDSGERKDVKGPEDMPRGFGGAPAPPADAPATADSSGGDDAWVIPGPDANAESAEPELTPLGDFGGFDDFSADPTKSEPVQTTQPSEPVPPANASPVSAPDADSTAQPWGEPASPPPASEPVSPAAASEPFTELTPNEPPAASEPVAPIPEQTSAASEPSAAGSVDMDMDALADRVAKKVLSQLSEKVIQEIAWEVVPDLAEALIQKEIEEIKAKIPK